MVREITIVKLGGSVITSKGEPFSARGSIMKRLAREIRLSNLSGRLILVHGGGSFGHPLAEKYELTSGYRANSQLLGFARTHQAMLDLNRIFVEALLREGLPAIGLPPLCFIINDEGKLNVKVDIIEELLGRGFLPVTHGDVILDLRKGFTVLSGDRIVSHLASLFDVKRVVMGIDVDGLYTSDPNTDRCAKLLREASIGDLDLLQSKIGKSRFPDVTGGMAGKISEIRTILDKGIPLTVVNAIKPSRILKALRGQRVIGTEILKE